MTPAKYLTQWLVLCFFLNKGKLKRLIYTGRFSIKIMELKPLFKIFQRLFLWKTRFKIVMNEFSKRENCDVKIALNLSLSGRLSKLHIFSFKSELKVFLALVWNSHLIRKCCSSSILHESQKLHSLYSTGRRGLWSRPSSMPSLWELTRERDIACWYFLRERKSLDNGFL